MKRAMFGLFFGMAASSLSFITGCAPAIDLPEAAFDKGGVTFDFAAASARRFRLDVPDAENLVTGDRTGEGKLLERTIALPDDAGGDYLVSYRYTMTQSDDVKHEGHSNGGLRVTFEKGPAASFPMLVTAGDPYPFVRRVTAPAGSKEMKLRIKMHEKGAMKIRDLAVTKAPKRPDFEIRLGVHAQIDNTYAVPSGQCALVAFEWRRAPAVKIDFDTRKITYRVTLPKGLEFVDTSCGKDGTVKTEATPDGGSVTTFERARWVWVASSWDIWGQRGILIRTAKGAPIGPYGTGSIAVLDGDRTLCETEPIAFFGVPAIAAVAAPKTYFNGVDYGGNGSRRFLKAESIAEYARFMADCGVKGMISVADDPERRDIFHAAGVTHLLPSWDNCANGYMLGGAGLSIPEDVRFVYDETDDEGVKTRAVCPIAVYTECAWFKEKYVPALTRYLTGADGMWGNWEPYMFINRGCFCGRCKKAFADYLQVPETKLDAVWPKQVVKTYKEKWDAFRAREHGRLVLTLDKYVRAATGGEKSLGFAPGVEWTDMGGNRDAERLAPQYDMRAYAADLKWIEPWGPYAAWEADKPYFYLKYKPIAQFFGAADIRRQVDADYALPKRPKLMSYPQGIQGGTWIGQPETIAMGLDSYFFNRWEASMVYFFPKGADARYWRPYAQATARAGKYEDFVMNGTEKTDAVTLTPVKEYAVPCSYATRYVPWSKNAAMLQTKAFEKDGTRIVAAFNFWQKGEAFFDLKTTGLKGSYRVIDEDGVLYTSDGRHETWTAEELARGIRLAVGAMRTKVFEIVPAAKAVNAKALMTRARLDDVYEARKAALAKEAEEDARYEKANPTPPRDYMPMI